MVYAFVPLRFKRRSYHIKMRCGNTHVARGDNKDLKQNSQRIYIYPLATWTSTIYTSITLNQDILCGAATARCWCIPKTNTIFHPYLLMRYIWCRYKVFTGPKALRIYILFRLGTLASNMHHMRSWRIIHIYIGMVRAQWCRLHATRSLAAHHRY